MWLRILPLTIVESASAFFRLARSLLFLSRSANEANLDCKVSFKILVSTKDVQQLPSPVKLPILKTVYRETGSQSFSLPLHVVSSLMSILPLRSWSWRCRCGELMQMLLCLCQVLQVQLVCRSTATLRRSVRSRAADVAASRSGAQWSGCHGDVAYSPPAYAVVVNTENDQHLPVPCSWLVSNTDHLPPFHVEANRRRIITSSQTA